MNTVTTSPQAAGYWSLSTQSCGALEAAAAALARLDAALDSHPLAEAWLYRARLDAVRREAAVDGRAIDPWRLAAALEGVRWRIDGATAIDRGMIFAAARHALELYRWRVCPDAAQRAEAARAAAHLRAAAAAHSVLLGAGLGAHSWLDQGGERGPLRAALSAYWVERGLARLPCPFSGAAALAGERRWAGAAWCGEFLAALAGEAEGGLRLLRVIERQWRAARHAVKDRRRGSHAAAAVDVLAAAPVVSATTLAAALAIAPKNAGRLLEGLTVLGVAVEVTHRSKRRLYGLQHLAQLGETAAAPRRSAVPSRAGARPDMRASGAADRAAEPAAAAPIAPPPLPRFEPESCAFDEIDRWMAAADEAICRAQRALEAYGVPLAGSSAKAEPARARPGAVEREVSDERGCRWALWEWNRS